MERFCILWAIGVVGYLAALLCIGGGMFFTNEADPSSLQGMLHQWLLEIWKVMTLPGRLFPKSSVIEAVVGVAVHSLLWGLLAPLLVAMLPNRPAETARAEPARAVRRERKATDMEPLPKRIEDWATTNAFQIVSADRRRFFVGPFSLRRNVGHVYRIVVRGRNEDMGEGWLALQNSYFGKDCWEEVKWIRKPAHTVEPRPEDVVAQQFFGVSKMGPQTGKWSYGLVVALIFFGWGLASLVYGRFVVPSRGNYVIVGIPALLLSLGLISLGLSVHLRFFWSINPKADPRSSPNARAAVKVLLLGGSACVLLGLCIQFFSFLIGLAA